MRRLIISYGVRRGSNSRIQSPSEYGQVLVGNGEVETTFPCGVVAGVPRIVGIAQISSNSERYGRFDPPGPDKALGRITHRQIIFSQSDRRECALIVPVFARLLCPTGRKVHPPVRSAI